MALWLVRTGSHGEHEGKVFDDNRIYLTWEGLNRDLSKLKSSEEFKAIQAEFYPDQSAGAVANYAAQMRAFVSKMAIGDWVVVPSKLKSSISIAEISSNYRFDKKADDPYFHYEDHSRNDIPS